MFSRLLTALDDDLLNLDYPRSPEAVAAAARVKDAMRGEVVPQIASAWFDLISLYRSSDPELAAEVLDTMRRYISWIDIGLVANDAFIPLLFELILTPSFAVPLRASAAGCVLAILSKRMEPRQKLALLRTLYLTRVFGLVANIGNGESELISKVAALITGYAAEALDCYKRLGSEDAEGVSMQLLEEALPSVFFVIQNCDEEDSGRAVDFLSDYVSLMKSPSEKQLAYIGQILELIRREICYDPGYRNNLDLPDKIGKEVEDHAAERRKDMLLLFRAVCRVLPDLTQQFIRSLLADTLSSSQMNVEEAEVALSLFYCLGETISEEGIRTGSGLLRELIPTLLSAHFSCHSHRIVALIYLETITRYMKFVQENTQYIPHVLVAFLDSRGMHHPNPNVCQRASYLFMRTVKLLKSQLVPFLDEILQSLQDIVCRFTKFDWTNEELTYYASEDGSHTFEAIGLLIGMESVSSEKQSEYLAALLTPLCQQVESFLSDAKVNKLEDSSPKVVGIQQTVMAINALSKGFSERLVTAIRPAIGIMFKQMLDVLLQILVMFPNIKPLRNKVTSYLHRMVDVLGASVFPCLPVALTQLLTESEPKEMVNFLVLINQLICKFGSAMSGMLEEIFPAIASRLFAILPRDAISMGPGSNTEQEAHELQELERTFCMFLHVLAIHDLSSVFLAQKSMGFMEAIMHMLLLRSCSHKDVLIRKQCVQIFVRLIKDWCTGYSGEDKVPGFRRFIIETFATNCCLYSVLDKSFDFHDANSLLVFGEIVVAQKVMHEKFGDDFTDHFVSKGLLAAHCSQDLAEQYYYKLQGNDIRALKSFYQYLIEKLRQQQNGSLVFR